jgi:hypothetical protein
MLGNVRLKAQHFLLFFAALAMTGCQSGGKHFAPTTAHAAATGTGAKTVGPPRVQGVLQTSASGRVLGRDSAFTVYNDPANGVSFRYPRIYLLEEADEDSDEAASQETQKSLDVEEPGSVLVATVQIPADAYPRTTFVSGTLRFIVNSEAAPEACYSFVAQDEEGNVTGSTTIQGAEFQWRERAEEGDGTNYNERDYAGYANGACYEFRLAVVSSNVTDADDEFKPAETQKILHQLEKIVASTQFYPAGTKTQHP